MSTVDRYRKFYAWQEAIKLSLELYRLADELPDGEQDLLARDLRLAAVDVPVAIAMNLVDGEGADMAPMIRLQTEMELIGRVYPALDTGRTEQQIEAMAERMADQDRFTEQEPELVAAPKEPDEEPDEDEDDEDLDGSDDDQPAVNTVHITEN